MIIRQSQAAALALYQRDDFENRVAQFMKQRYPRYTCDISNNALRDFIHESVEYVLPRGITQESDVAFFCTIRFMTPADVHDEACWCEPILTDADLNPAEKLLLLQNESISHSDPGGAKMRMAAAEGH